MMINTKVMTVLFPVMVLMTVAGSGSDGSYRDPNCIVVPSAPKVLQLMLASEDPPAVSVTWQAPRNIHGILEGYRLTFGITGETEFEEKRLDAEKVRLTTGYLGMFELFSHCVR